MTHATLWARARTMAAACARDLGNLVEVAASLGLALVACAACCAAPLALGALGVGGLATGAACAEVELPIALAIGGAAIGLFLGWRRRAAACSPGAPSRVAGGAAMCSADGSCGCAPARGSNVRPG